MVSLFGISNKANGLPFGPKSHNYPQLLRPSMTDRIWCCSILIFLPPAYSRLGIYTYLRNLYLVSLTGVYILFQNLVIPLSHGLKIVFHLKIILSIIQFMYIIYLLHCCLYVGCSDSLRVIHCKCGCNWSVISIFFWGGGGLLSGLPVFDFLR